MLDVNNIDFRKPTLKNATHTLDVRVLSAISELSDKNNCSKSDVVNTILKKVFEIE